MVDEEKDTVSWNKNTLLFVNKDISVVNNSFHNWVPKMQNRY
jgi:hypothetical protein